MNEKYMCYVCDISFSKEYNLRRHLSKNICQEQISNDDPKSLKCDYCSKVFDKNSKLERHLSSKRGKCYKLRNDNKLSTKIINKSKTVNNYNNTTIINNIDNSVQNIQQNINNICVQPIVNNIIFAKPGEETISHITKDVMLEILNIESFPKMCTELMRLLYFNKEVPENRNWTIVYPRNQNAGVEYNHSTKKFERKKTYNIIDDKFSNMVNLLFDLVQEISRDDIENDNLSKRQKINVNKYCMHFGQLDISKTSREVYDSIHSLAYNSRKKQMETWGDSGHKGNHLSLKFK